MDSKKLADMVAEINARKMKIHSLLVIRHGYLVSENYFNGFTPDGKHELQSVVKSFIATLVGSALDQRLLSGTDQRVVDLFSDRQIKALDERKQEMTVEDLLTMRSGLDYTELNSCAAADASRDVVQYMLDLPMAGEPGARRVYCTGCSYLLSDIVAKTSGMSPFDFADRYLLNPLGIASYRWSGGATKDPPRIYGINLTPRDMAKLGHLYLRKGQWDGQQNVSSAAAYPWSDWRSGRRCRNRASVDACPDAPAPELRWRRGNRIGGSHVSGARVRSVGPEVTMSRQLGVIPVLIVLLLWSCASHSAVMPAIATLTPVAGLPNPASVSCQEQGFRLELRTDATGSQSGICHFPDGSQCDEWAYYRGECGPASQAAAGTAPAPSPTRVASLTAVPLPATAPATAPAAAATYTSAALGIRFSYLPDQSGQTVKVLEQGDKIYVYPANMKATAGQWVQVFQKPAGESLVAAITRVIMPGYPMQDCQVIQVADPVGAGRQASNYEYAGIVVRRAPGEDDAAVLPRWRTCPQPFTVVGGIGYFQSDALHPSKFLPGQHRPVHHPGRRQSALAADDQVRIGRTAARGHRGLAPAFLAPGRRLPCREKIAGSNPAGSTGKLSAGAGSTPSPHLTG